ncbi:MAG: DASS family sodium-coupled anion symporter [Acidobacteriota bacterium]|nr:DASS family sodium-coupled anion symporter [Acidobacteriota bacterium]
MSDPLPDPAAFDRRRQTVGLFLGPAVLGVVLALPTGLSPEAHRLAAVFALVIVFWVTEAIPLGATALLGTALAVVFGVADAKQAFASFGHPIIFLFLGSFLIAAAMARHGLDRRIALFVLSRSWVGERRARILLAFGAIAAFLSMWMSNTATTAMMLPIGLGVLAALPGEGGSGGYSTALMLMIAFSCNIGGIATPVGTPPNLIALGMFEQILDVKISFVQWMGFGVPVTIVCFVFAYIVIRRLFAVRSEVVEGAAETFRAERAKLGSWSAGEKAALTAFLVAVTFWTLPGILSLILGSGSVVARAFDRLLPESAGAILAASLLFVIPVDWSRREFALDWRHAVRIDWGTILLFGGGLALGSMAFSTGLAEAIGSALLSGSSEMSLVLLVLIAVFIANVMTEFMSNTATANLLIPTFLALAGASSGSAILPAIGATVGCSLAFCLPVATPPNALVYGSGHVPLTGMIRAGVCLDLGCGLLAWVVLLALRSFVL